jgi:hypothetical protein
MPVLTKKAIERAGMEKNRLIFVTEFCPLGVRVFWIAATGSSWADPISHTVCGERVVIPGEISFVGSPAAEFCPDIPSCPTKAHFL